VWRKQEGNDNEDSKRHYDSLTFIIIHGCTVMRKDYLIYNRGFHPYKCSLPFYLSILSVFYRF
jgi:hypothetical protein